MDDDKYKIHRFSAKLLQKPVYKNLGNYLEGKTENYAPVSINLDLITACSHQCLHCIDKDIINTGKMLDLGFVKELVSKWAGNGLKSVILIGGGEPTLYPYFEKTVEFLKGLGLQIGLVTNGSQNEKVKTVSRLFREKDWVRISIDAGLDATFQSLHRPKIKMSLEELLESAGQIKLQNPDLQLGYSFLAIGKDKIAGSCLLPSNLQEISLAARKAKENGFSYLSVKPFIDLEGTRATRISDEDLAEIRKQVEEARKLEDEKFKVIESVNLLCFYDEVLKKSMQSQPKICHAQNFRLVVAPAGIFQCSLWRGFKEAKIIDTDLELDENFWRQFEQKRIEILNVFDAKKTCKDVFCLYAPLNAWMEDLKRKGQMPESIEDFNDYFL